MKIIYKNNGSTLYSGDKVDASVIIENAKEFGQTGNVDDYDIIYTDEETNTQRLNYLNATDWYVTRFAEAGVEIPVEIQEKRAAARASIV